MILLHVNNTGIKQPAQRDQVRATPLPRSSQDE